MPALGNALGLPFGRIVSGWTPAALSPMIWFNAASLAVGNGNPIGTWTNDGTLGASGNATASGTARPTLDTSGINSLPAAVFDSVDDLMSFTHTATTAFTIWFVFKSNSAGGRQRVYDDAGNNRLLGFYDGARTLYTGSFLNNGSTSTGVTCFIAQASSSGRSLRINGTTVTDATSAGALTGTASLGNSVERINGRVAQVGVMNRILTAGELTLLANYLTGVSGVSA